MQTEDIIFSTVSDARYVRRRLSDHGVLSSLCGREVRIAVTKNGRERDRELALRLHKEPR